MGKQGPCKELAVFMLATSSEQQQQALEVICDEYASC